MTCETCQSSRETQGRWPYYDNRKCAYCAARLIQRIPANEPARRRVILDESVAAGLSEKTIRELVSGPMAFEPVKGRK